MNRFDRILWRINGVLFLILLLVIMSQVWSAIHTSMRPPFRRAPTTSVNAPRASEEKLPLHLGDAARVKGTPFLRLPLQTEAEGGSSSFASRGVERRVWNYRYLNATDLSAWWLFESSEQVITGVHDLHAEAGGNDRPVVATLFEVVVADTDGDHRLTSNDREAVFFSAADGKKPAQIIAPTDGVMSIEQVATGEALIVYRRDDHVFATVFSDQDGSKIRESQIDSVTKQ